MTKKLIDIGPAMKKIRDIGQAMPRLDPALIAAALGAEMVPDVEVVAGSPLTLHAVRAEVFRRLQSSGGRPALEGTNCRVKIPLSDEEWRELETIAAAVTGDGCTPSAGQIASVLLNLAIRSIQADLATEKKTPPITKEQLRDRLAEADVKS